MPVPSSPMVVLVISSIVVNTPDGNVLVTGTTTVAVVELANVTLPVEVDGNGVAEAE